MNTIKINKKEYPIQFGFKANRILAEIWGLKTFGKVMQKVQKELMSTKSGDVSFDQYITLSEITLAGIKSLQNDVKITADDIVEVLFKDVGLLAVIMKNYTDSLPKAPPESKNVKRGRKK